MLSHYRISILKIKTVSFLIKNIIYTNISNLFSRILLRTTILEIIYLRLWIN